MSPDTYLSRIADLNPSLNAFVDLCPSVQKGNFYWGVKSNIAVEGLPHTAGIGAYRDRVASSDAVVVRRIRASGGAVLGTLNMHEGALGATTDNEAYGRTQNPWRMGYTPGGSSGGSGAAVAAGLCDIALGTDTMGSVRIPAAYCGVQGHKPSTGCVPTEGVVALSTSLDHVGPLARDVETLWYAMHVLAAWETAPSLSVASLKGMKFGVWDGAGHVTLTHAVRSGFNQALQLIKDQGATTNSFEPPHYDYSKSRRAGLLISEIEGALEHGIDPDKADPDGFSDTFLGLLKWGASQSENKKQAAYEHVKDIRSVAANVWSQFDFILAPSAPQQAFPFTELAPANQADFTAWADFAALPATAIFAGLSEDGLPLSIQIIGPHGADRETLQAAAAMERLFGRPPSPPI